MKSKRALSRWLGVLIGGAAIFACGYWVSQARASGVPGTAPMTYSGVLTDPSGTPLTGSKNILLQLYPMATGGTAACTVGPAAVTLEAGTFKIELPAPCTAAVNASPDLWVEVFVDNLSFGRSKLGAVPYALQADTASNAAGPLAQKLATIPSVNFSTDGYVTCRPITDYYMAGFTNVLVRAALYSDAACATAVDQAPTGCHEWCAAAELRAGTGSATCCGGVAKYYTRGVVDVLRFK